MLILTVSGVSGSAATHKIRHPKRQRTAAVAGLVSSRRVRMRMRMPGRACVVLAVDKNTTKSTVVKKLWRTLGILVTAMMMAMVEK
jgi:hypothetical protein